MTMRSDLILSSACVLGLFFWSGDSAVAETGVLTQLPEPDACVSEGGTEGACAEGVALNAVVGVAVSPDGRNVYVTSFPEDSVAVFARDRRTVALTQLPGTDACVSETGSDGACADGVALRGVQDVVVSKDGR